MGVPPMPATTMENLLRFAFRTVLRRKWLKQECDMGVPPMPATTMENLHSISCLY
jgi:hypothetical protein